MPIFNFIIQNNAVTNSLTSLCVNEINGVTPTDLTDIVTKLKALR